MESYTEEELIKRCIDGQRLYQKELFDRYSKKMMTVCRRYGRDDLEAEDILQEGFIKVFRSLSKFKFKGSFEGWIRRIMINTALNKVAKKRRETSSEDVGDIYLLESQNAEAISRLTEEEILKIISQLPQGYKLVFNLYAIEGYSHREIGELLGIEEATSRSQLTKARKLLQNRLQSLKSISA